jgi:dihydrofolate synthase/folylpolyglutamate synthase
LSKFEKYLESKINQVKNKNLIHLDNIFTHAELSRLRNNSISVVGTNGKTSTAMFLKIFMDRNNISSLLFTSPHLVSYKERIESSEEIDFDEFYEQIKFFENKNNLELGYFETLFLISCLTFLNSTNEYFICEAGIGGKLDTTSILQAKTVVLTNIGLDHVELLGDTHESILREKIHISNSIENLFNGVLNTELNELINQYTHIDKFYYLSQYCQLNDIDIDKLAFNEKNYLLALMTFKTMFEELTDPIVDLASEVNIPGRFEIIQNSPLKIVDGAHNLDGVKESVEKLLSDYEFPKYDVFVGFKVGKSYKEILEYLSSIDSLNIKLIEENSFFLQESFEILSNYLKQNNIKFQKVNLDYFSDNKNPSILLGSLYLIGEYKKRN